MSSTILYLKKASDEAISFCTCGDGKVSYPAQMDCPWCGCGWLFTCISCRKAFTFAEAVELDETWEDLAAKDLETMLKRPPTSEEITEWITESQKIMENIKPGEKYVIIDGTLVPYTAEKIGFEGWYAKHNFDKIPQVLAITNMEIIHEKLANQEYWEKNAVPKKERYRAGI